MKKFYVYVLFRPDGRPCYVGKGRGNRIDSHEKEAVQGRHCNPYLARIIRKAGGKIPKVILHYDLDEHTAFQYERELILAIGREVEGGPLTNLSSGGEGNAGFSPTEETRAKISLALQGVRGPTGIPAWNAGKPTPIEVCEKLRKAKLGKPLSEEHKTNIGLAVRGKKRSAETRARMSLCKMGHSVSQETRDKIRETKLRNSLGRGST